MTGRPSVPEWREMLASLKDGRKGQLGLLFHRGEVQYCLLYASHGAFAEVSTCS